MITYTVTRENEVLRFIPYRGIYLSSASIDGGVTFTPPQGCSKKLVDEVVNEGLTTNAVVVESRPPLVYHDLVDNFHLTTDHRSQRVTVEAIYSRFAERAYDIPSNARHLLLQIQRGVYENIGVRGVDYALHWSKSVLAELALCATRAES